MSCCSRGRWVVPPRRLLPSRQLEEGGRSESLQDQQSPCQQLENPRHDRFVRRRPGLWLPCMDPSSDRCSYARTHRHTKKDAFLLHLCRGRRRKTEHGRDRPLCCPCRYADSLTFPHPSPFLRSLSFLSRPQLPPCSPCLPPRGSFSRSSSVSGGQRFFMHCPSRKPASGPIRPCFASTYGSQIPFLYSTPSATHPSSWENRPFSRYFSRVDQRFFAISHLNPSISKGVVSYRVPNPYIPVVLLRTVEGIGLKGQLTQVRRGTYRHVLQPRKLAVVATWQNIDRYFLLRKEKKASLLPGSGKHEEEREQRRRGGGGVEDVREGARRGGEACAGNSVSESRNSEAKPPRDEVLKDTGHTTRSDTGVVGGGKGGATVSLDDLQEDHSEESIYSYLGMYRPTFLVDTEATDAETIQGDGLCVYDVLERLTSELELDLLPSQVVFYKKLGESRSVTTRAEDSLALLNTKDEEMRSRRGAEKSSLAEDEELRSEGRIRKCGVYEVYLIVPAPRAQQNMKRSFLLEVSSKQERMRLVKERQRREEEEAKRLHFSLGEM